MQSANSVRGQPLPIPTHKIAISRAASVFVLPGAVPADILCLDFAARAFHHLCPWLGPDNLAAYMLGFNTILLALFAMRIVVQKITRLCNGSHHKRSFSMRSLAGVITAAILGPVWWNVFTYGEASIWLALPFIYGVVLALLACSIWNTYTHPSSSTPPPLIQLHSRRSSN